MSNLKPWAKGGGKPNMTKTKDVVLTEEILKERIVNLVALYRGIKPLDLVVKLTDEERASFSGSFIEELISEGKLMEVEYTVDPDSDQIHSFLLPASSEITVRLGVGENTTNDQPLTVH